MIPLANEASTLAVAAAYAQALPSPQLAAATTDSGAEVARIDRALKLYLQGDLGAGKTCFARGFLVALGVERAVRSPTYSLLELYPATELARVPTALRPSLQGVAHLDLYRLGEPDELESLGLADFDRAGWVWLIEWPERGAARLPRADLHAELLVTAQGRALTMLPGTELGRRWHDAARQAIAFDAPAARDEVATRDA